MFLNLKKTLYSLNYFLGRYKISRKIHFYIYFLVSFIFIFTLCPSSSYATSRLITMNVHCMKDDWKYRTEQILNKFIELNPEVIALQEVCKDRVSGENQVDFIFNYLKSKGYPVKFLEAQYTHTAWDKYEEFLVLITSKNVSSIDKGFLPASLLQRSYIGFMIEGTWFVNTHLEYRNVDRYVRREQLLFLVNKFGWLPHVIMGDFNSSPVSYEQRLLSERGYNSFFPEPTFVGISNNLNPMFNKFEEDFDPRIDGFWFDPKMSANIRNIHGFVFLKDFYKGRRLSDHLAVFVTFNWHN